jgi:hypothetical protein
MVINESGTVATWVEEAAAVSADFFAEFELSLTMQPQAMKATNTQPECMFFIPGSYSNSGPQPDVGDRRTTVITAGATATSALSPTP